MQDLIATTLIGNSIDNKNIGDMSLIGAMLEATDIKGSGLDLFAHYGYSMTKPNKELKPMNPYPAVGLLHDANSESIENRNGHAFWLGGRYTFENLHNSKIGLEYNQGSQYWSSVTHGADYLANKLATRGKAIEFYGIYPINRYSFIKLGALQIENDYTNSGIYLGEPREISTLPTGKSTTLEKLESLYLQFSVKF